ncbi:TetR family transcriptional regulator [Aquabacterium sp. NJ1]|uniref:TetR/AcrR family transcriptional regulator n=1 Tax=Aquabacterium sp. NJ1 TaxID=1538295 RepID=UPI00052CE0D1|nr:TetR/AcrR family transcriptional regulator [Aquabacterium sp. NJ1]KGM40183.1 TetR family transcriptional regulator [Aquabacterium sp. NJ1]
MRYGAEHKQRTHDKVVKAAADAIRLHGPDKIGVAGLMSKVGLTHGGFYAHFKSKDELIAEAIDHMFDERYETFRKCFEGVTPAEGMGQYIELYLSTRHRDRRDKGCPLVSLSGDVARLPLLARKRFEAGVARLVDAIAEVLMAMGQTDAETLAASVVSEMVGAVALSRAVPHAALAEQLLAASRGGIKKRLGLTA